MSDGGAKSGSQGASSLPTQPTDRTLATETAAAAAPADFGKYQLFASLGRGGMADVFLAVARGPMGFNKLAVVKRLRPQLAHEPAILNMFLDEARLAARLNHPNIVHTYEVGECAGNFFIAMEYLEGQSLNEILKLASRTKRAISPGVAVRIVADALAGLHHAHELKDYDGTPLRIVHRDVSPHNVFVTYDGQVKLVDFGIAKAALSSTPETEVGVLKGKVGYMAPEQAMGEAIDGRADLFAMGICLWELLTKKRLMHGENQIATLGRLLNQPVPRVSSVVPDIDPELDEILARALDKDRTKRFQTAHEMRESLRAWLRPSVRSVREDDIGLLVSDMFRDLRENVKAQIQKHMMQLHSMPSARQLASLNLESLQPLAPLSTPSSPPTPTTGLGSGIVEIDVDTNALRRKKSWAPLAVLLVLAVLGGGIFVLYRSILHKGARVAAAPPVETSPQVTPPQEAPAPSTSDAPPLPAPAPTDILAKAPAPKTTKTAAVPKVPPTTVPKPTATAVAPEAGGNGFLAFSTYPWTRVSEGGRVLGTTPLYKVPLTPGTHTLTLENPDDGIKTSYTVTIKSGETTQRSLGLK